MRILVIYCHPVETSYAAALRASVLEGLADGGHEAVTLDLYGEGFAPVLSREERLLYRDTTRNSDGVEAYTRQLREVQGIVLVYPTWWYGMPAMLKGYFDRVWLPGVAFDIARDGRLTTGRLGHIRRLAVVTTCGATWWLTRLYLGDPARRLVKRGLRPLCARDCRVDWYAHYDMDRATQAGLAGFRNRVRAGMAKL